MWKVDLGHACCFYLRFLFERRGREVEGDKWGVSWGEGEYFEEEKEEEEEIF